MAKVKAARKKKKTPGNLQALPCLFLVLMGILLLSLLFWAVLRSA